VIHLYCIAASCFFSFFFTAVQCAVGFSEATLGTELGRLYDSNWTPKPQGGSQLVFLIKTLLLHMYII